MKQNIKWLAKWNIKLQECSNTNADIRKFVREKFHNAIWNKNMGRKKAYYIKEFNPTGELDEKAYLGAGIKERHNY